MHYTWRRLLRSWLWELLAITTSTVTLIAMIILLFQQNNKPVFSRHGFTLNTIVAVLSTVSKTTLLYAVAASIGQWKYITFSQKPSRVIDAYIVDEASRGPLGGLRLIWRTKFRNIVVIGAVCTVLSLVVDPFTQQLVQYHDQIINRDSKNAFVSRALRYDQGALMVRALSIVPEELPSRNDSQSWSATTAIADPGMQSAVQYGLTHSTLPIEQQLPFTCNTGNCTFETFRSLAVCSTCVGISDLITVASDPAGNLGNYLDRRNGAAVLKNATSFTLPNGLFISNDDGSMGHQMDDLFVDMATFGTTNTSATVQFQDLDTMIWSLTSLRVRDEADSSHPPWPDTNVDASECALFFCVNEYDSSVKNGILHENVVVDTTAQRDQDSWQLDLLPNEGSTPLFDDDKSVGYNPIMFVLSRTDLSLGGVFNVSQKAAAGIGSYIQATFSINYYDFREGYRDVMNGYYMGGPDNVIQYRPDSMQVLHESTNLSALFENVAQSMSNAIRADSDDQIVQTGKLGSQETRYRIQWPWITLHLVVAVLGILTLTTTMAETTRHSIPTWKSHLLPVLFWGSQLKMSLEGNMTLDEMEEAAWRDKAGFYQAISQSDPEYLTESPFSIRTNRKTPQSETWEMRQRDVDIR